MNSNALSVKIPSHILSESLSGETILLDMSSGMYFGLTPVASRFWKLMADGSTREDIHTVLLDEFDVDSDVLSTDLDSLLVDLEAKKLIQRQTN